MSPIVDGHLDLAMNALQYGRDITRPLQEIRDLERELNPREAGTSTVSLPEMRRADLRFCLSTAIARVKRDVPITRPALRGDLDYPTPEIAHAAAIAQVTYYQALARKGEIEPIASRRALEDHWNRCDSATDESRSSLPVGLLLTLEGADPIVDPSEIHRWWNLGLRTLMLAHFGPGRYAHGTPGSGTSPRGGLTDLGRSLLAEMASLQMALDLTHLDDRGFAEAAETHQGPIYASHSNCRALAPSPRQLEDDQIDRIVERNGVIGIVLCNAMLAGNPNDPVGLDTVVAHIDHICQRAGNAQHVAIGSDLDGGFGQESSPSEIESIADLARLGPALTERGFSTEDAEGILGRNWYDFWRRVLPES